MSVRIRDLQPGDRVAGGVAEATLIAVVESHPVHPDLAAVVWRLADGTLQVEAVDQDQEFSGIEVAEQSVDERIESLVRAIEAGR